MATLIVILAFILGLLGGAILQGLRVERQLKKMEGIWEQLNITADNAVEQAIKERVEQVIDARKLGSGYQPTRGSGQRTPPGGGSAIGKQKRRQPAEGRRSGDKMNRTTVKLIRERVKQIDRAIKDTEGELAKSQERVRTQERDLVEMKQERAALLESAPQGYAGEPEPESKPWPPPIPAEPPEGHACTVHCAGPLGCWWADQATDQS